MTIGTGFHTYEIERGPATGRFNVYRIGAASDAFIGSFKTAEAAIAHVRVISAE